MNSLTEIRTPYNTQAITLAIKSTDRKQWRDQYCIECGHPFISISDKFVSIVDAAIPINLLRSREIVIEARCSNHYCKQRFNVYV